MNNQQRQDFIEELVTNVKHDLQAESAKYPEKWDGIELRWRIADIFSQVVFGESGKRKGKRYLDYKNTVYTENLK